MCELHRMADNINTYIAGIMLLLFAPYDTCNIFTHTLPLVSSYHKNVFRLFQHHFVVPYIHTYH